MIVFGRKYETKINDNSNITSCSHVTFYVYLTCDPDMCLTCDIDMDLTVPS